MSRAKTAAITVCAAMAAIPSQLSASSCNHPIVGPIKFKPNAHCWEHRGTGTHFFGQFRKGQTISIGAAGSTNYMTGGDFSWSINNPWQIYIEGPSGFSKPTDTLREAPGLGKVRYLSGAMRDTGCTGNRCRLCICSASDDRIGHTVNWVLEATTMYGRKVAFGILILVIVTAGAYWTSLLLSLNSLETAFRDRDVIKLEKYIDWVRVREQIRSEIKGATTAHLVKEATQKNEGAGALFGTIIAGAIAPAMIDQLVNDLVTARSLAQLLNDKNLIGKEQFTVTRVGLTDYR